MKNWIEDLYYPILNPISDNKNLKISDVKYEPTKGDYSDFEYKFMKKHKLGFFYESLELLKLYWKTFDKYEIQVEGSFDINPIQKVMFNWDDDLGGNDWAPDMKGFRPLDMFYDSDGFVGFYVEREDKKGLYLVHSDSSVSPLHIDFEGYLKLLIMSKGFGWWQNALVEISTGAHQPNVDSFKENMPKIFPEFNYEEFKNLYESLRIDK